MRGAVIVSGARTAFGKFGGMYRNVKATDLGAAALRGAVERSGIAPSQVEQVIMGMAIQAGTGQIPSRQAAIAAGLPGSVPSETINKVCASGMRAIALADQCIRASDGDIIVAGGMESMTNAPFAVHSARWGIRMGNSEMTDLMMHDGLLCAFDGVPMAMHGNRTASIYGITREEQDEWALRSHSLAVSAIWKGRLADEIVPVPTDSGPVDTDECPRTDTSAAKLANLRPLAGPSNGVGTITAGNAPGVNDGAAAVLVMSEKAAHNGSHITLATILGHASVSMAPHELAEAPARAIRKLLQQTGVSLADIDLFEVNEAFAAVVLTCGRLLSWDENKVNVNGGAIAIGHPLGASGTRIVLTLAYELKRRGGGLGIAAICSGGGQGDAMLIRVEG
ncbi:acetyl-CoA C-acetyltransferase [Paenibacillus sp. PR3]|uniref:acetyl-CoA C-acetyltransferase n=1 Tax=Paenibacillus terricola TaxID=2763503 RepID=A0ABR8MUD0_9BACL|nr:acetyl-CoA C-acetyltransferase [Paenibacillus terricola]MBD3919503.1 acetyl-CoA C-acetyltransferase [Paenibacillus terricola]